MKKYFTIFLTKNEFVKWYVDRLFDLKAVCMEIISLSLANRSSSLVSCDNRELMNITTEIETGLFNLTGACCGTTAEPVEKKALNLIETLIKAEELGKGVSSLLVSSKIRYFKIVSSLRGMIQCIADGSVVVKPDDEDPALVNFSIEAIKKEIGKISSVIAEAKENDIIDENTEQQLNNYAIMADFYASEMWDINNSPESVLCDKFKEYAKNAGDACCCIRNIFAETTSVNIPEYRMLERGVSSVIKTITEICA